MQTAFDRKNDGASGTITTRAGSEYEKPPAGQSSLPTISLPKGGGAIRGIGEKFGANPVVGTASASIPIFTSPGRSGFGPSLSLSYDSGSGNGAFGLGWSLSLPSITRKTEKGLPLYRDVEESDTFILSGSEDLVPELVEKGGQWERHSFPRTVEIENESGTLESGYFQVQRYRPRIEGLFARIERWTNVKTGEIHWRSISRDNITTFYGKTKESRISDPYDPSHTFSWLICESYDDKGNAIVYNYLDENSDGVDLTAAHERNRTEKSRSANRYLKSVKYGNLPSRLVQPDLSQLNWMFEVVFDYGEHDPDRPTPRRTDKWLCRHDPFSSYRAGFEIRTYRLCQRILMFHHFPNEIEVGNDCLVRSTDFVYRNIRNNTDDLTKGHPIASFISSVTQNGYRRLVDGNSDNGYLKRSMPPVEFEYSEAIINEEIEEIDPVSLENLPYGIDGARYQWVDLDGEGVSGILTEQGDSWFYKPNLGGGKFGPIEKVAFRPSQSDLNNGAGPRLMDLAGDGQLDLVSVSGPTPGFFERKHNQNWENFVPFESFPNVDWNDPNLRLVDLTGDGHTDILVTENEALTWYPSLAERGFGPSISRSSSASSSTTLTIPQSRDEEHGPRLVFADGTQSIYLADMSGHGLTDLVRLRNGEVCYWPNLGYGRFGSKVNMDKSPWFDTPDVFDQSRIRLADIDGSGVTDIIYIGRKDGVRLYFNQSGNSWAEPVLLKNFPPIDNVSSVVALDLFGNGTACLVWSSSLVGNTNRPMRYIDLMGGEKKPLEQDGEISHGQKPHLLISVKNNMGAETRVEYKSSTEFYLADKAAGKPWVTRLPFPVHVVERVKTYDHISRNYFVTRFAYHHGYFDGDEREFRGFGMVEQYDTEEFKTLDEESDALSLGENIEESTHVPPVCTKTWFHTGIYLGRDHVSNFFAGFFSDSDDNGEYYREPGLSPDEVRDLLLPDTELSPELSIDEEREACRALKGSMLRQEVYAFDGTPKAGHPYTVTEQNFTVKRLQPRNAGNRHAVFFVHSHEAINFHYERRLLPVLNGKVIDENTRPPVDTTNPEIKWVADPRVQHSFTLDVDSFGNVVKSAVVGYGRRFDAPDPDLLPQDQEKQKLVHIVCTQNTFTIPKVNEEDMYRTPLPAESSTYELRKVQEEEGEIGQTKLYKFNDLLNHVNQAGDDEHDILYEDIDFTEAQETGKYYRRLIERVRTLYRPDDLGTAEDDPLTLLPLRFVGSLACSGETFKLAFTPGLLAQVFKRGNQILLPPADQISILGNGQGGDKGGYAQSQQLKAKGLFPNTDPDDHWWIPSGRVFLSPNNDDNAAEELEYASEHFFLPLRYRDPFHTDEVSTESLLAFDIYDLLMLESRDAVDNLVTVGQRLADGTIEPANDYRVLQPTLITDPNGNRTKVVLDTLGMVTGTAVMGKDDDDSEGDDLNEFKPDLTQDEINEFYDVPDPHAPAADLLMGATTRVIYDLHRFHQNQQAHPNTPGKWLPVYAATLARETHVRDPLLPPPANSDLKIQISFSYSDGFGREIQSKIQAEPGPVVEGGEVVSPRWVVSGWIVPNNKGKAVRQYEPFFSQLPEKAHHFEFGVKVGVSPVLFYDPVERVIATLLPNHTYEKVLFDPWKQVSYDVNDTAAAHGAQTGDPRTDRDIIGYVAKYFAALDDPATWKTWFEQRQDGAMGQEEETAAEKAAAHANTPTTAHLDTLGRPFLTIAHNRFDRYVVTVNEMYATRVELDIEGNQREVRDAKVQNEDARGRIVMQYDYDMLGNQIHQLSMEAGERWVLNDVAGNVIRSWDSRDHTFRTEYDPLRRSLRSFVLGADTANPSKEVLTERLVYGEQHPEDELLNLNLRGELYLQFDQAGVVSNERYDFKGNLLRSSRQLTNVNLIKEAVDWRAVDDVALPKNAKEKIDLDKLEGALVAMLEEDDERFTSRAAYDALNRPIQVVYPHSSKAGTKLNVTQPVYNDANLLERVDAWLELNTDPDELLDPITASEHFVSNIDYNARGQRELIEYGNGVKTTYNYDKDTFRLKHMQTVRDGDDDDADKKLQDLFYFYDPAGNIVYIHDRAHQPFFFNGGVVKADGDYTYDAIYRLIKTVGREHEGQASQPYTTWNDEFRIGLAHPHDGQKMRNYLEVYDYDEVGNILTLHHKVSDRSNSGNWIGNWIRRYEYQEESLVKEEPELDKKNNRLSRTIVHPNAQNPIIEQYTYDLHGNTTSMPHLREMESDFNDQLKKVNLGGGGLMHYIYGASGQRVRKVHEHGALVDERIYFGNFEIYREHNADGLKLERETLNIMDDKQNIALIETRTVDNSGGSDPTPRQLIRYQLNNHLRSACVELDDKARLISYEEYTPYGSTSFQSGEILAEVKLKRYRYTGMERDEESGFDYHGARYYAPWLGRWISSDPAGLAGGIDLYAYASNNPIGLCDRKGTQPKPPDEDSNKFTPPEIPEYKGNKPFKQTITLGGRSVETFFFPGTSDKTILILGGVHQDEEKAIKLSQELLHSLQTSTDKPFFNVIFIPDLFQGRAITGHGDVENIPTNRNFPDADQPLSSSVVKETPRDSIGRKILPENVILISIVEKVHPYLSLSIHSHSRVKAEDVATKGAASVTVDPKPGDEQNADFLTTEVALAADAAGLPVPGNMVDQDKATARTRYPNDTAPAAPGVTFGNWGSHRGGMNQYLIEAEGHRLGGPNNFSKWVPIIQSKFLSDFPVRVESHLRFRDFLSKEASNTLNTLKTEIRSLLP
jgi:RHS repeat-associated protein